MNEQNTTTSTDKKIDVAKENYDYFLEHKDEIPQEHFHQFVLMHNKDFVGYYNTEDEAFTRGCEEYGMGKFSIQEVNDKPINLGILSCKLS